MFVLLAWAGGVAMATTGITFRGVVGPGFTWLAAATIVLIGGWSALGGDVLVGVASLAAVGGGLTVKSSRLISSVLLAVSTVGFVAAASQFGGIVLALSAALALGGITGEMLLGHWYLVDPTLSRTVLRVLALVGTGAVLIDVGVVALLVGLAVGGAAIWIVLALTATTAGLMGAVVGALRYPAYAGVMAATGLSYLAVLTGLSTVFLVRVLAVGGTLLSP